MKWTNTWIYNEYQISATYNPVVKYKYNKDFNSEIFYWIEDNPLQKDIPKLIVCIRYYESDTKKSNVTAIHQFNRNLYSNIYSFIINSIKNKGN